MDASYQGQCVFDKPHGIGSMTFKNSSDIKYFDGDWIAGQFHNGILIYKNGDQFKGLLKNRKKFKGTLTFANGGDLLDKKDTNKKHLAKLISKSIEFKSDLISTQFIGMWHDDSNSEGTLLYESGSKYVGQLQNNKRHGNGAYTYPNPEELNEAKEKYPFLIENKTELERISFTGEWEEDIKVRGVIIYRNGDIYEGQL